MDISLFLNFRDKKQLAKDVVLWFFSGFVLLFLGKLLKNYFLNLVSPYIIQPSNTVKDVAFFLLLILLFITLKYLFGLTWIFWNTNRDYIFKRKDWLDKWIFNGKTGLANEGLLIKSSRAGCLLKNNYWKNFKMSFEMKFSSDDKYGIQKRFGIIFRAEDLDNYFMIEIGENEEKYKEKEAKTEGGKSEDCKNKKLPSSIKPQVRYRGGWEIMSAAEITGATFDFSDFVKVSLEVNGYTVLFFYKEIPVFKWTLPTHVDINHIESGVKNDEGKVEKIIISGAFSGHVQKIPFRLGYGSIGFRAHPHHTGTYIRNLKVEPL